MRVVPTGGVVQLEWLDEVSHAMHHSVEARVHSASAVKHARAAQIRGASGGPSASILSDQTPGDIQPSTLALLTNSFSVRCMAALYKNHVDSTSMVEMVWKRHLRA